MSFDDPIELLVAEALKGRGIRFVHESDSKEQGLDFWLPDHGIFIECKQFSTPRTAGQIADKDVIVIQGRKSAEAFAMMLLGWKL